MFTTLDTLCCCSQRVAEAAKRQRMLLQVSSIQNRNLRRTLRARACFRPIVSANTKCNIIVASMFKNWPREDEMERKRREREMNKKNKKKDEKQKDKEDKERKRESEKKKK